MNLFIKEKHTRRYRKQTYDYQRGKVGGRDKLEAGVNIHIRSDQISRSVVSDSLRPHESQHARPPCPSPTPRVH